MSRLDELIQELCPDGVEYKKISSFTKVLRGKRLTKDKLSEENSIPVYHGGIEPLGYYGRANRPANMVMIINVGASAGTVAYSDKEFWSSDGCFCIDKNDEIDDRYLYHYLKNNEYYFMSKVRKAGIPTLDNFIVEEFKIPVPPLEVQREIVRILDSFTLLTARQKQYEYYRDTLLSNNSHEDSKKMLLSEFATIKNGKDYKHLLEGEYPVYGSGGVMTHVNQYCYDKPTVLIPRKGSLNNLFYVEEPFWNVDTIFYTEIDEEKVVPKYLYYLLQKEHIESLNTAGGVPSLTQTVLNKVSLLIPPLEKQKKVVACLDNFDTICSDLNIGLPAEIDARQKQYDFYRDLLLTFAETGNIIAQTDRQTDKQ